MLNTSKIWTIESIQTSSDHSYIKLMQAEFQLLINVPYILHPRQWKRYCLLYQAGEKKKKGKIKISFAFKKNVTSIY